jgi:crotonobetainyl-CoA:carnitine CoA-transferase CaiB-like acyl-CoA transferase
MSGDEIPGPEHDGPLAGIKVIELSMYVQGPVSGLVLASLGADVIKIKRVGRLDHMRTLKSLFGIDFDDRGREWLYASLNRNKRSIALDVASDAGRPVFHRLIEDVIDNRDEFRVIFADHLKTQPNAYWWERLRQADIWVSPVNRVEDLADDEHIRANDYMVTFDDGFVGPPAPFDVDAWQGARGLAADYAEHTDDILSEMGLDEEQILELKAEGAVW